MTATGVDCELESNHIAGAALDKLGGSCLVVLGHLLGCFAPGFTPAPLLLEAYLGVLAVTAAQAHTQHSTLLAGISSCLNYRLSLLFAIF